MYLRIYQRNVDGYCIDQYLNLVHTFMDNIEKWPGVLKKYCVVKTARFVKYVWPFCNITHGKINYFRISINLQGPL